MTRFFLVNRASFIDDLDALFGTQTMPIQDFKRWQWTVVGLLLGAGAGMAWKGVEPSYERVSPADFRRIVGDTLPDGTPEVQDIVIHPAVRGGAGKPVQWVTFTWNRRLKQTDRIVGVKVQTEAETPFVRTDSQGRDVVAYLTQVKEREPGVEFQVAWWRDSNTPIWIGLSAGAILVGGVWPTLVRILVGAGLGSAAKSSVRLPPARREATPTATPGPTAEDLRAVSEYADRLEQTLGAGATPRSHADTTIVANDADATVRPLDGGPLHQPDATEGPHDAGGQKDAGHFEGEWYPVFKPDKKK
jgi:hypothetical protein